MFPCTKCGCCCKRIGHVIKIAKGSFPYKADENGACEMLENNKCKVYDHRPDLCNIDKMATLCGFDKEVFYVENIKACNEMMDQDNIPLEYRITLK